MQRLSILLLLLLLLLLGLLLLFVRLLSDQTRASHPDQKTTPTEPHFSGMRRIWGLAHVKSVAGGQSSHTRARYTVELPTEARVKEYV